LARRVLAHLTRVSLVVPADAVDPVNREALATALDLDRRRLGWRKHVRRRHLGSFLRPQAAPSLRLDLAFRQRSRRNDLHHGPQLTAGDDLGFDSAAELAVV